MATQELISIVVPVYNAESFLKDCIDSLVKQTYKCVEIILVNDGSTDKSGDICEEYAERFSNVRLVNQQNQGQNAARLKGVLQAQGAWIMFVDADDFISHDMCDVYMAEQIKSSADIVIGGKQRFFNGEYKRDREQKIKYGTQEGLAVAKQFLMDFGRVNAPLTMWSILFRKHDIVTALETIDLDINFSEDCACVLHVLSSVNKAHWINEDLYYYRVVQTSFTQQHKKTIISGQKKLLLYWEKIFDGKKNILSIKELCDKFVIRNLMLGGFEFFYDFDGLYPFVTFEARKKIALYGAGILGEEIREKASKKCIITNVFDQAYLEYQKIGRNVKNPDEIANEKCDYVIVAIWNKDTAENVARKLRKLFKDKVILTVDEDILNSEYTSKKIEELRNYAT